MVAIHTVGCKKGSIKFTNTLPTNAIIFALLHSIVIKPLHFISGFINFLNGHDTKLIIAMIAFNFKLQRPTLIGELVWQDELTHGPSVCAYNNLHKVKCVTR